MNADLTTCKFPVLAAVSAPFHIHAIRELTDEEEAKSAEYVIIAADAHNRFKLFSILARNFADWANYTQSLFTLQEGLTDDEMTELDRLQLNYLSSAKSLLDHFRQHWIQSYRNTPKEKEYDEFMGRLERNSWAFAFYQDLRNFTQHCGLPTGNYSRSANINSITLQIEADSKWLLDHYNRWDKSKLAETHGQLNLLLLMREYNVYLREHFGNFVATEFAPSLLEAHEFFANLSSEVTDLDPKAQFRILTGFTQEGSTLNFQFKSPPGDLMGSIGIAMRKA